MVAKGYALPADIGAYLGTTLTAPQLALASTYIAASEAYIDRTTRKAWLVPPITNERYNLTSPTLYLRYHPVTSVGSVTTRTQAIGDLLYTAIAGVDYEVFDLSLGQINFSAGYSGPRAVAYVSYTPALSPVPADIFDATVMIVAAQMEFQLHPERFGVAMDRLGPLETRYDSGVRGDLAIPIPARAQSILDGHTLPLFA